MATGMSPRVSLTIASARLFVYVYLQAGGAVTMRGGAVRRSAQNNAEAAAVATVAMQPLVGQLVAVDCMVVVVVWLGLLS